MKSNPYTLGLLIILSVFLYLDEDTAKHSKKIIHKTPIKKVTINPILLKDGFHAHELDETSRAILIDGPKSKKLSCSFNKGKSYFKCKPGDMITWSRAVYRNNQQLLIKDSFGPNITFSPKSFNPLISFHACDRYLKRGTTELSLRNTISNLNDRNNDGIKTLCFQSDQKIQLKEGPLVIKKDMAIIGTHNNSPVITSLGDFPVFKNENKTLFLYNLKLLAGDMGSHGISLGVGSYLGADNLNILVSSQKSEGIHCFGCTIDGDRVEITAVGKDSKAISTSLGLLELRWARLVVNGENSHALKSNMGSFTNIIESSHLISNETGAALDMNESGIYFSSGKVVQNGMGTAIYLSDLDTYKNEFRSLEVKSKSIAFMVKNAKNIFLKDIVINSKGARMVNLGASRVSRN